MRRLAANGGPGLRTLNWTRWNKASTSRTRISPRRRRQSLSARAIIRESRAQYLSNHHGWYEHHQSTPGDIRPGKGASATYSNFSLPVQASWEPDLWGRVRNTVKANSFAAQASAADLENVRLAAQAELALDYFELRAQDDLKQVLDATVSAYREALELTRNLSMAGLDSDEAVAQAESQWKAAAGTGYESR